MSPIKLYAELQANPRSQAAYRRLADHYRARGLTNEAEAFLALIRRKFDAHRPPPDEEQRPDDPAGA